MKAFRLHSSGTVLHNSDSEKDVLKLSVRIFPDGGKTRPYKNPPIGISLNDDVKRNDLQKMIQVVFARAIVGNSK